MIDEQELGFDHEGMADALTEPEVSEEDAGQLPDDQPEEQEASAPQTWTIDGVEYGEDAIRAAARFRAWLAANPQRQEDLVAWERGERVMVPTAFEPEDSYQTWNAPQNAQTRQELPDDDEYLTDEERKIRDLEARMVAYERSQAEARAQEDRDIIDAGFRTFREQHPEIDAEGFQSILLTIRDKGWMQGLNQTQMSQTQRWQAVQNLAEDAYRIVYFQQAQELARQEAQSSITKQVRARRRAASAGGTSPSVPRSEPDPSQMTEQERRLAMVRDLGAAMSNQ